MAKEKKAAKGQKSSPDNTEDYIYTGVPGLDTMMGEGIPSGASVLVEGGPGSGKTMFCLAIALHYCKMGKKVLYMSFEEPEKRLMQHLEMLGKDSAKYVENGQLRMQRYNALDVARSVEALLSQAKKELLIEVDPVFFPTDFKPDLVLVDSLTSISSAFSGADSRFRIYMEQLFRYLEKENISSFLIREVANPSHIGQVHTDSGEAVSFLSDGIIVIYNVLYPSGERGTGIEILKMRGAQIKRKIVKMTISKDGLMVYPDQLVPKDCTLT